MGLLHTAVTRGATSATPASRGENHGLRAVRPVQAARRDALRRRRRAPRLRGLAALAGLLCLLLAVLAAPVSGHLQAPAGAPDHRVIDMADATGIAPDAACCPDGGHLAGTACASCLLAIAASLDPVGPALPLRRRHRPPAAHPAQSGGPDVPHGPPRLV